MKNFAERTTSTDDDDDIEAQPREEKKEQPKQVHHLPGISIETKSADRKPEKRLSLSQVFEKMGTKPMVAPKEKVEEPAEAIDKEEEKDGPAVQEVHEDSAPELEYDQGEVGVIEPSYEKTEEKVDTSEVKTKSDEIAPVSLVNTQEINDEEASPTPTVLEAANWESEEEAVEPPMASKEADTPEDPPLPEAGEPEEEPPVEADLLATGLGAEGPPEPPKPPETHPGGGGEDEPPEPPAARPARRRAVSFAPSPGSPWYSAAAADRARVDRDHERELNDAAYYAEKHGLRRGLLAGGLVGWMFGKRGKKKQAKEFTNQLKSKEKDIKNLKDEQFYTNERVKALQRTHEQQLAVASVERPKGSTDPENSSKQALKPAEAVNQKQKSAERPPVLKELPNTPLTEKAKKIADFVPIASVIEKAGQSKNFVKTVAEKTPQKTPQAAETVRLQGTYEEQSSHTTTTEAYQAAALSYRNEQLAKLNKVLPPEDRAITEQTYHEPEGSKVEASAWHRIEIDKKTGKAVENPDVAYGEEFQHEQQEVLRENKKRRGGSAQSIHGGGAGGGAAGHLGGLAASSYGAAGAAGQTGSSGSSQYPTDPSMGQTLPVTPIAEDHLKHLNAGSELLRHASSPVIWTIAVVIVLALFILGVLR